MVCDFFFFNDTSTTEIYTLSLHDALPIYGGGRGHVAQPRARAAGPERADDALLDLGGAVELDQLLGDRGEQRDRKSTRLNSSHANISYAVFCLKKKNTTLNILYLVM